MAVYNVTADSTTVTIDGDYPTADYDPFAFPAPATKTADDYLGKVTPWQANPIKARFLATVRAGVQPYADAQAFIASLPQAFDVDEAEGAQLDIVGQWIGRSRYVPVPLPNVSFACNIAGRGVNQGILAGPYDSAQGISALPNDLYRRLLYAKIAANAWDGTAVAAGAILTTYITDPDSIVFVNDNALALSPPIYFGVNQPGHGLNQSILYRGIFSINRPGLGVNQGALIGPNETPDVPESVPITYTTCVAGKIPSAIDLRVLDTGLVSVKAMGAALISVVTTVDGAPLFGLNMDNAMVSGLNKGAIGASAGAVADLIYG